MTYSAQAQVSTSTTHAPAANAGSIGFGFSTSKTEYERKNGLTNDVDRKALHISGSYGLSEGLEFFGNLTRVMKTDVEGLKADGDGYGLGLGVKGFAVEGSRVDLVTYGLLQYLTEDMEQKENGMKVDIESTLYEVLVGLTAVV